MNEHGIGILEAPLSAVLSGGVTLPLLASLLTGGGLVALLALGLPRRDDPYAGVSGGTSAGALPPATHAAAPAEGAVGRVVASSGGAFARGVLEVQTPGGGE